MEACLGSVPLAGLQRAAVLGAGAGGEAVECTRLNVPGAEVPRGACADRLPQAEAFLGRFRPEERLVYANPPRTGLAPPWRKLSRSRRDKKGGFSDPVSQTGCGSHLEKYYPEYLLFSCNRSRNELKDGTFRLLSVLHLAIMKRRKSSCVFAFNQRHFQR